MDKVALGQVFLRVLRFPPSLFHSTSAPYSSSSSTVITTDEWATSGDLPTKVIPFWKLRTNKKEKFFHFYGFLRLFKLNIT